MLRRLHYLLSDVHLEYLPHVTSFNELCRKYPTMLSNVTQPVFNKSTLILAGDIGHPTKDNYWKFLKSCSDEFQSVLFITGNHEYDSVQHCHIHNIDNLICQNLAKLHKPNLHFLNMTNLVQDNIRYLGATIWSNMPNISENVNTKYGKRQNAHLKQVDWLTKTLKQDTHIQTIIITHHMPSFKLIHPKYTNHNNFAFATDLEYLLQPNVKLWLCGHTHTPHDMMINNCRYLINPIGRVNEEKDPKLVSFVL